MNQRFDDDLDTIDAYVFTGDVLHNKEDRENFKKYMKRWSKAIKEIEKDEKTEENIFEDFEILDWKDAKNGEDVWIAGNLKSGIPTKVYGPHKLICNKMKILKNKSNERTFYERWSCLYKRKEIK